MKVFKQKKKNKLPSVEGSPTARKLEEEPESESGLIPSDFTTLDKPAHKKWSS